MHPVKLHDKICVSSLAAVVGCSWRVHGVFFWGGGLPKESLAVFECGFGHGLESDIGAVGNGIFCGSSKGQWSPW